MQKKLGTPLFLLLLLGVLSVPVRSASAQGNATAEQALHLSAFGAFTATWTGLNGVTVTYGPSGGPIYTANGGQGRNLAITAGGDIGFEPYRFLRPSLEVRGSYPIDSGSLDSQRNVMAGLRLNFLNLARAQPYGDVLFGRQEIDYSGNGYPVPGQTYTYVRSDGNVLAVGGGAELPASGHFALKLDFQLQHYATPVTTSGHIWAKAVSAGITYRFDFNHHPKQPRY